MKITSRTVPDLVIEDIQKVTVGQGDVVIIHLGVDFQMINNVQCTNMVEAATSAAKQIFPNNKIIIFDNQTKISIVTITP